MSFQDEAHAEKSTDIIKQPDTDSHNRKQSAWHHLKQTAISCIGGVALLAGTLVLGTCHFSSPLSARENTPVAGDGAAQEIEQNEIKPISASKEIRGEKAEPEPYFEIPEAKKSPSRESARNEPVKSNEEFTTRRPERPSAPPGETSSKIKPPVKNNRQIITRAASSGASLPAHDVELFYQKALRYHRDDRLTQAVQMYQQVIRANPGHRDARFNLGAAYIQLAAYSEAYPLLKQLRAADHLNPDILVNCAIVEIGMGRPAEAIHLLDGAARQLAEPRFGIYFHRAVALSRLGKLEEARLSYKKAEELNGGQSLLLFNLAVLSDKLHRYDEAVQYYEKFLRQKSTLPADEKKKIEERIRSLQAYAGSVKK
ncbi:MAG: tetratricopeptide repeat protein [Desulfobacterales bacterium]